MAGETAFGTRELPEPAAPVEASSVVSEKTHAPDELPPSLYREARKVPLVLELVGAPSAYRHFDMEALTNETDRAISAEAARKGLPDTKESYRLILEAALDRLNLPSGSDAYATIEMLSKHFRIQEKLYAALKERQDLADADPLELSAAKLKLYLERNHGIK